MGEMVEVVFVRCVRYVVMVNMVGGEFLNFGLDVLDCLFKGLFGFGVYWW